MNRWSHACEVEIQKSSKNSHADVWIYYFFQCLKHDPGPERMEKHLPYCLFLFQIKNIRLFFFCRRSPFLIIADNYKYVRRVAAWRPWTPAPRLTRSPLSISSRCSRLMELLIGGEVGFPRPGGGGRPRPYLLLQKGHSPLCVWTSTTEVPPCTKCDSLGFLCISLWHLSSWKYTKTHIVINLAKNNP